MNSGSGISGLIAPLLSLLHLLHLLSLLLCCGLLVGLAGCEKEAAKLPVGAARLVPIRIGNQTFSCEIADNDRSRSFGLMLRSSLPQDRGMIFIFHDEEVRSFWMKNTLIPLDIIYLDKSGKVVAIRQMKPRDLTGISSEKPAMYAIELNAGAAERTGLKEGDTVQLPALPKAEE